MALTRTEAAHTYKVESNGQSYRFTVVLDSQGLVSVRDVQSPLGLIRDSFTPIPEIVSQAIQDAISILRLEIGTTEVDSGTLTFTGQVEAAATIAGGTLNNTAYRVVYTTTDGVEFRTKDGSVTTTGFTAETTSEYGTVESPKDVSYSVVVATSNSSTQGAEVTILDTDSGTKTITFPASATTDNYRVVLSPIGLFPAWVSNRTKTSFDITIGITLGVGQSVKVGYDIFM